MAEETVGETLERVYDELEQYYEEINGASDRAAAILAAEYFSSVLRDAIVRKLTQANSEFMDRENSLFGRGSPISSFSSRIKFAYALGLYNDETKRCLSLVSQIRNRFAHASRPIDFSDDEIANKCRQLRLTAPVDNDSLRERYVGYLKEVEDSMRKAIWCHFPV